MINRCLLFRYFPHFAPPKRWLPIQYHVHIWLVSPQASNTRNLLDKELTNGAPFSHTTRPSAIHTHTPHTHTHAFIEVHTVWNLQANACKTSMESPPSCRSFVYNTRWESQWWMWRNSFWLPEVYTRKTTMNTYLFFNCWSAFDSDILKGK